MGIQPKSLGHKIFNRKYIFNMDNELENRLQNVDETTIKNNNKNNNIYINCSNKNENNNKMSFINNYFNSKNLLKITNQKRNQHHHHNYNFKNKNHYTILQILLITFLIFMLRTTTINCLPVTSKPIENTPEHLAWEAWIMLPPPTNPERHRKIMPKSIFVLPTNINNNSKDNNQLPIPQPQIQCPPGYRVDNSKCIPIISINRDQLLIDQLTNLLPVSMKPDDSSYDDYDYDYTYNHDLDMLQSYQKQQLPPLINNNPNIFRDSEKNSEPLKINLSLDKFLIGTKDDKQNNKSQFYDIKNDSNEFLLELNNENSNEEIKLRPFRDQEASPSHIELSKATLDEKNKSNPSSIEIDTFGTDIKTEDKNGSESFLQEQQQYSTIFNNKESSTISSTSIGNTEKSSESYDSSTNPYTTEFDKESQTESKRESIGSTDTTTTENTNHIQHNNNNDDTSTNPNESTDILEFSNTDQNSEIFITTLPTTDSTTMVSILSSDENEMSGIVEDDFNSTTTSDYEYDQMTTLNQNDNTQESNKDKSFEIVTEETEKEKNLEEKLSEESLVLDKSTQESSTESSSEILLQDDITTNSPLYEDISSESLDQSPSTVSNNIQKSTTDSSNPEFNPTNTIQQKSETTIKNENNSKLEHKIVHANHHRNHHNHHSIPHSTVRISASQPIEWHEDREPLMESIESNNRFVYHHLGSSSSSQADYKIPSTQSLSSAINKADPNLDILTTPESTTQPKRNSETDIKEQLRIINMIVEENKRRAQANKVRFPDSEVPSSLSPLQNLRSQTQVNFPTQSQQQVSNPYKTATSYYQPQSGRLDPDKLIFHRRFFQNHQQEQQYSTTHTPHSSTSTTAQTDTQKPFWWLPSGWEIDQSGDRPMLIRFWSRSPSRNSEQFTSNTESYTDQYRTASSNTHHIVTENLQNTQTNSNINSNFNLNTSDGLHSRQHTTTTSRYRENSRSPTDNLYREVPSSQNVYKVLNAARQWKYNNR